MSVDFVQAGQVLGGRYAVERYLARGGASQVFVAIDMLDNSRVAMKVTRHFGGTLLRERELSCSVVDDALVPILDYGTTVDGYTFIVSEFIDGASLAEVLRNGPRPLQDVLWIAQRVGQALSRLHATGVLHRDIKPRNILIPGAPATPMFERAKLLDLGVAAVCNVPAAGFRTQSGLISGTVRYMAPEQLTGRRQSAATDLYALGLVLQEALYGPAQDSSLPIARAVRDGIVPAAFFGPFVHRRLTANVAPPADPAVPQAFHDLLERMTRLRPAERAQSASEAVSVARAVREVFVGRKPS
jgi:serine/threonine protein kinase